VNRTVTILTSYLRTKWTPYRFRSRGQLLAWQERRVRRFLAAIVPRSPFYAQLHHSRDLAAWQDWPAIDKATMMANFDRLNTAGIRAADALAVALAAERTRDFTPTLGGITVGLSSGTSGSRGLFLISPREQFLWVGAVLAKTLPTSLLARHRVAFFLRANSNLYTRVRSSRIRFDYFDLLDPLDRHLARLNDLCPTLLAAPPSMLRRLAEALSKNHLCIAPQKVIAVAEVLDPLDEAFLRRRFGQPIHQVYQATEGFLGSTCRFGTLHLHEDLIAFQKEYLDREQRKFVPIVTDFHRTTQPIIRYRLDDILTERAEPCPCGSVMTALASIEGRCDDLFYFAAADDASLVPIFPDFIRRAVIAVDGVAEYQVRQLQPDLIHASILASAADIGSIQQKVAANLLDLCHRTGCRPPQIEFTPYVPPSGPRKFRRVERAFDAPADVAGHLITPADRVPAA
jgi:putative adenylate-forming enzyme